MNAFQKFIQEAKFDPTQSKFFEDNFEALLNDVDFLKQCQDISRIPAFKKLIEQTIKTLWMSTNKENYDLICQSAEAIDGLYLLVEDCAKEFDEKKKPAQVDIQEEQFDSPPSTGELID